MPVDKNTKKPRYDTFAKNMLGDVLEPLGALEPQKEIAAHPQFADLLFVPAPDTPRRQHPMLSLIYRMGDAPALFEPFSKTPTTKTLTDVLSKSLNLDQLTRGRKQRVGARLLPYRRARVWVLSPGKPGKALADFRAEPNTEYGIGGFYGLPDALYTNIIVIRELPRTPETLLLRLMGRGAVLEQAMDELAARIPDDIALHVASLVRRWITIQTEHSENDMITQELVEHSRRVVEKHEEFIRQEGHQEGRLEGRTEGTQGERLEWLRGLVGRRLGRKLNETELAGLKRRAAAAASPDALFAAVLDYDPEQLTAWLIEPA